MGPTRHADPARFDALLALFGDALRYHLGEDRAVALLEELRARAEALGPYLLDAENPARPDASPGWDERKAAAYVAMEGTGAVHLELGPYFAFPDERKAEHIAADGLGELIRLDVDPECPCDVVADATALPLRSSSVDRVASDSVFEHIAYPHDVLRETYRVLRPGGVMVIVTPFIWGEHGYPDDYVRLAPGFFRRVCTEIGFADVLVDVDTSGGLYNVLHNLAKVAVVDEAHPEAAAMREIQDLAVLALGHLIPLDRYFTRGARYFFHSVRVLARKPGTAEPHGRTHDPARPFAHRALDLLADPQTKQPLRLDGAWLVCDLTGRRYAIPERGPVDFLAPAAPPTAEQAPRRRGRVRSAARRLLG